MLDLCDVVPGANVLDVAAGAGGQTVAAARRVGPHGNVLARYTGQPKLRHQP